MQVTVIVYLIDTIACDTAGTQKQLLETIRRLDRSRWEPHLVCLWESPFMRGASFPCPVHVLGHEGFLKRSFPGVVRRLGDLLDRLDAGLVHVFFDEAIFVAWLGGRGRRARLVSSRRDMGLGAGNQPWYHRVFALLMPLVNRSFAGIVTNSEAVREYAAGRERTPAGRYTVLRNGVDLPPGAAAAMQARQARQAHETVRAGIVASLTPVKRHDLLLAAWARLGAADARLVLVGDGPDRERLEALASTLGIAATVEFAGATRDVAPHLASFDIGVLCSDREGLSNAILEYMAWGLPVIATRVGGNPELVDDRNGILVTPGSVDELVAALRRLATDRDLRLGLGEGSLRAVSGAFGWDVAMSALEAYYERILRA